MQAERERERERERQRETETETEKSTDSLISSRSKYNASTINYLLVFFLLHSDLKRKEVR